MIRYDVFSLTQTGRRTYQETFVVYGTKDYAGVWREHVMGWARLQGFDVWEVHQR